MKSYLSLIPISAKIRRRQNRMTCLCIVFAVFLVTAVFSMAEMGVRMEQSRLTSRHGVLTLKEIYDSAMGQTLFLSAAVLFLLILAAGVLMISSSINSTVAQRTEFFGMMRCIGMSRAQIVRFVRLEALYWCKTAVPAGLVLGIGTTWGLCAVLRFLVGEEFTHIPLFGVSLIGIVSGSAVGVITVLLAARSPAARAAGVSPVAAVSGNTYDMGAGHYGTNIRFFKIEAVLGIRHAAAAKKNLILMTGSFALSIILFLCFSVLIDWVDCVMPQSSSASDIDISSEDGTNSIDGELAEKIRGLEGVKRVYGRRNCSEVPAQLRGESAGINTVDLVSFDDFDLECLKKDGMLKRGSDLKKIHGDSSYVLTAADQDSAWKIGTRIQLGGEELEIAGLLKYDLFSADGLTDGVLTLITSSETFARLTGEMGYSLLMVQTDRNVSQKTVDEIRSMAGAEYQFHDRRDEDTSGTYLAFVCCVYGFLTIIALVTVLNIVNSISISVSARMKQYGAMRAVGMEGRQITKMIAAETFVYALSGCAAGCGLGLPLCRWLYGTLISSHFVYAVWSLPWDSLLVIIGFVIFASSAAVYAPAKRIRNLSVTETINEL